MSEHIDLYVPVPLYTLARHMAKRKGYDLDTYFLRAVERQVLRDRRELEKAVDGVFSDPLDKAPRHR